MAEPGFKTRVCSRVSAVNHYTLQRVIRALQVEKIAQIKARDLV